MFGIFHNKSDALRPRKAGLEACTLCQLDCRGCYMRKGNYCAAGAGYLKFRDFAGFLEANPFIEAVELANSGEVFLNPDLAAIIRHAREKGVDLSANRGTNFNDVSDEALEAMARYGFSSLTIALDGSSQKAYSWYRRGGDFGKVIANIKRLNVRKKKYGSGRPYIGWQYVVLPSNDSLCEIRRAKRMAEELGMDGVYFQKDWNGHVPENAAEVEMETGLKYRAGLKQANSIHERWVPCADLWRAPQVNWDGRLFGCCVNADRDFGANVFEAGLEKALGSRLVRETKKMLMGGGIAQGSPCLECVYYKDMAKTKDFVRREDVLDSKE